MFLCVVFRERPSQIGGRAKARIDLLIIFGGLKAVVRPDPIPNSAVKRSVADGSGFIDSARVGSRQFFKKSRNVRFGFFITLRVGGQ